MGENDEKRLDFLEFNGMSPHSSVVYLVTTRSERLRGIWFIGRLTVLTLTPKGSGDRGRLGRIGSSRYGQ